MVMNIFKFAGLFLSPLIAGLFSCAGCFLEAAQLENRPATVAPRIFPASDEAAKAIQTFRPARGLKVDLFAAEPLLANPVAFCFDERGRIYLAETFRRSGGVLDIETRVAWADPAVVRALGSDVVADYLLNEELASTTVEESIALLKRHLGPRAASLSGVSERLQLIVPGTDGKAGRSVVFAEGFDRIGDGLASGVLARKGKVWFACIPDLWQLQGGTDSATDRKSLQHGYGVRVGSGSHALHGLRLGPDGKLYFSVGDRGANVRGWDGSHVANPECGAVYRCNLDGSDLELFAIGLRNPQGLAFDKFGNLFTGDNNSDAGDPSRWVYVVEGGDSGWRVGYQFLERPIDADTLTQPPQSRGVWLNERQCYPQFDGQAAFLVPPIDNIANGPSGLTYYPGVGLPEKYDNHFFLCDFKGSAANSLIHSFATKPKGAGFELIDREVLISNVLATDVQFGPDCCIYLCDWVNGWPPPGKGRIYRIYDEQLALSPLALATKTLIAGGMEHRSQNELVKLLAHPDQRVRQEAQFALADAGAVRTLSRIARENENRLARLHAIWALGQIADPKTRVSHEKKSSAVSSLLPLLSDQDSEVAAQTAKVLGNARSISAYEGLLKLLANSANPRGQFFAALGLGKLGRKDAVPAILELLRANADRDAFLRHAGVMALVWIKDFNAIIAAAKDDSAAVRMGLLLALRRLEQPEVAMFLQDADPRIVVEAARAINDASLYSALPDLAGLIAATARWAAFPDGSRGKTDLLTPLLRRVINAHFRVGDPQNAVALARFAARTDALEAARFEALQQLGRWEKPSARDQITGLYRPLPARDSRPAAEALRPVLARILTNGPTSVRLTAAKLSEKYVIREAAPALFELVVDGHVPDLLRAASLKALAGLDDNLIGEALKIVEADASEIVRVEATRLRARTQPVTADKLVVLLENGTPAEQQNALATVGSLEGSDADAILGRWLDRLLDGRVRPELQLDLLEAAAKRNALVIKAKLEKYEASLPKDDDLAHYRMALVGGSAVEGKKVFFDRPEVSCIRCHKIGNTGNEVGSVLTDVGSRRTREYILESIVYPNKQIAAGFETVVVTLKNGSSFAGIVKSEDGNELVLKSPDSGLARIRKLDIEKRERGLSGMPDGMGEVLSKRDLRNLVEFLASQIAPPERP
jgi:quinoprotein glucose dehydrogenase